MEILQARYPMSVVTMLSAYYYYDLTDNIPDKCHLAVERGSTKIAEELYPAKMEDYLDAFPKREVIFDVIRKEVL